MAGSCAAKRQPSIGNVEAGSPFACAQSAGAGGQCCCYFIVWIVFMVIGAIIAVCNDVNMFD